MGSQVAQARALRQIMFHQLAGRLREQDLATVSSVHDACCAVHIQANVAFAGRVGLTGVQTHAHAHGHSLGPGMRGQGTLGIYCCCRDGIAGTSKGYEEGIALRIDLMAVILVEMRHAEGDRHVSSTSA